MEMKPQYRMEVNTVALEISVRVRILKRAMTIRNIPVLNDPVWKKKEREKERKPGTECRDYYCVTTNIEAKVCESVLWAYDDMC